MNTDKKSSRWQAGSPIWEVIFCTKIRTAITAMMKLCAQPARIWSAVTCHRFGRFGDLSPKQGRVQRPGRVGRVATFDGDKSPAESADKSAHSKVVAAPPRCVHLCPSVVSAIPSKRALHRTNLLLETCPGADYIPGMKPAALRAGIPSPIAPVVPLQIRRASALRFTFYVLRSSTP